MKRLAVSLVRLNYIRRVDRINIVMIFAYGLSIIISMLQAQSTKHFMFLLLNLVFSISILLIMNQLLKHEPIVHRSPIYYYAFLTLTTITVYIDGGYSSNLFPIIFVLPVLYTSVNFSRKGSTGIAIFASIIILLTVLQKPEPDKIDYAIIITLICLAMPQLIGLMVKEYVMNIKRLIKGNRNHLNEGK